MKFRTTTTTTTALVAVSALTLVGQVHALPLELQSVLGLARPESDALANIIERLAGGLSDAIVEVAGSLKVNLSPCLDVTPTQHRQ